MIVYLDSVRALPRIGAAIFANDTIMRIVDIVRPKKGRSFAICASLR